LDKKIEDVAQKERRSKNSQYVYILENWFELKDSLEEKLRNIEEFLTVMDGNTSREKTARKKKAAG
jgi:hypothetical protein